MYDRSRQGELTKIALAGFDTQAAMIRHLHSVDRAAILNAGDRADDFSGMKVNLC
jgi:hypothetical protein